MQCQEGKIITKYIYFKIPKRVLYGLQSCQNIHDALQNGLFLRLGGCYTPYTPGIFAPAHGMVKCLASNWTCNLCNDADLNFWELFKNSDVVAGGQGSMAPSVFKTLRIFWKITVMSENSQHELLVTRSEMNCLAT